MNAEGYTSVSISDQVVEGFSLDSQAEAIRAFVQAKGWTLSRIYTDAGLSGTRTDRPALCALVGAEGDHRPRSLLMLMTERRKAWHFSSARTYDIIIHGCQTRVHAKR
jgi:site-specific DNA recombinase